MPYKDRETQLAKQREHYKKHKQSYLNNQTKRRRKLKSWFLDLKSKMKCNRCEENHPSCLQFHHKDPSKKETTICLATSSLYWSKERILEEIAKCEVLCSNCHFKHHWDD